MISHTVYLFHHVTFTRGTFELKKIKRIFKLYKYLLHVHFIPQHGEIVYQDEITKYEERMSNDEFS